ncbi:hypothetical protein CDD82_2565 [Ophiocordyceps australis]|uniref:Uncharacterized protein n=1 Tax=Ophiocordyceps australis TaxID=1399860 RepID=A0A2C5XVV8_9HYPO|nr:hypothetical protein CDD82_2565 [Ophiocordyceps australis]
MSPNKADFPRDHVPSHDALQDWVESQIEREQQSPRPTFPQLLQRFLMVYSGARSLDADSAKLPKHTLVQNVHKLNCFFRIWSTSSFWCRDPANKITKLPLSVQARLRKIAREALKYLEFELLKSLDDCLSQHAQPQSQDKIALWASRPQRGNQ